MGHGRFSLMELLTREIILYKRRIAKEDSVLVASSRPFLESLLLGFSLSSLFLRISDKYRFFLNISLLLTLKVALFYPLLYPVFSSNNISSVSLFI